MMNTIQKINSPEVEGELYTTLTFNEETKKKPMKNIIKMGILNPFLINGLGVVVVDFCVPAIM